MCNPNFFIVGAPKCGTTALAEYLRQHPSVFLPDVKEPGFFCHDFPYWQRVKTFEEFQGLFRKALPTHAAIGEASTFYLRSKVAVSEITHRYPDARLIVMLRNPVDFMVSWHGQMLRSLTEDVQDFETAWRLSDQRRRGRQVPKSCPDPSMLDYIGAASFGTQVSRLLAVADAEQVLFICYDDFSKDVLSIYRKVLKFLDLSDDGRRYFPIKNRRVRNRSVMLESFLLKSLRLCKRLRISENSAFMTAARRMGRMIRKWNWVPEQRPDIRPELRQEMNQVMVDEVRRLEQLIGWNLSNWLLPSSSNLDSDKTKLYPDSTLSDSISTSPPHHYRNDSFV